MADAAEMGLKWEDGLAMGFKGINHDPRCTLEVRLFDVPLTIHRADLQVLAPVAFAKVDAPLLAGREGFLDCFEIVLNGAKKVSLLRML